VMNDTVTAPKAKDTPTTSRAAKLAAMIGTKAIGLHQGQR
jgi:hypothetical protein